MTATLGLSGYLHPTAPPLPRCGSNWVSGQVERSLTGSICDDIAAKVATAATFVRTALDGR